MADLPVIPEDINAPLPEVPEDSPLVPYRISSLDPTGTRKTTVGYGRRAAKPDPFAAAIQQAYATMPTEDAERAVAAAIRFQGLRGYQQDIKNGVPADQALAKWGPSLFYQNPSAMGSAMKAAQKPAPVQEVPANLKTGMPAYIISNNRPYFSPKQGSSGTAAMQNVDAVVKAEQEATAAEQGGNTALATQLRDRASLLREQMKGQQIVMGYDDQGRPIFQIGKGASPTVATASRAQQKLQKYENATEVLNRLQNGLEAGHVGIAGLAGEYLWDRGLVQLANLMGDANTQANPERVNSRAGLIMLRESLMREISDDPRFSNLDREEISKALPSSGAFESLSDAKQKLATVREIMSKRAKVYSGSINAKTPLWAMTADEIKEEYKAGKIDRKTAVEALTRYH